MRWMVLLAGAWWQAWARWRGGLAARIFFAATLLVVVVLGLTFGLTSLEHIAPWTSRSGARWWGGAAACRPSSPVGPRRWPV